MKISQEVRRAVAERDGILRPDGYSLHHCFFHSELDHGVPKEVLEMEWNYQSCATGTHDCIHGPSTEEMVAHGHKMELKYKQMALDRYDGPEKYREKLEHILNRKTISYANSI